MGHKNYSKFSERFKKPEKKESVTSINEVIEGQMTIEEVMEASNETMTEVFNQVMDEIVEGKQDEKVTGVVTGCAKLNVRKEPKSNATVLCVLDKGAEVVVELNHEGQPVPSDVSFYKVCTSSGVEGYCMTKYIEIK